ncbi:MAG: site-specific DNA-methyltransferase [bacterium]|nr:site-specific DNA-methyltransferase [bacterium]
MNFKLRTTLCGDSDTLLRQLVDARLQFDLVLTDPPYNLNKDFGNGTDSLPLDEFIAKTQQRLQLVAQLLSPRGSVLWFAIHRYVGHVQIAMEKAGLHYRRMNIWRYENGFSHSSRYPRAEYEPFLWYSKSDTEWTYNADLVRVPYRSQERLENPVYYRSSSGERRAWRPNPLGRLRGDIWEFPTLAGRRFAGERTPHPTQKPESLFTQILKAFCPLDSHSRLTGMVIDPFHGVGTTGVCAERLNQQGHKIDWVGIEIEPKWADIANRRVAELSSDLFAERIGKRDIDK